MSELRPPASIQISQADLQQMRYAVASLSPEEACGLLAGENTAGDCRVRRVIPVVNELHSPTRYRMAAQEQINAFNQIEAQGLHLVGIYHSHPTGPPEPSPTDSSEAFYPEAVYLIWFAAAGEWHCRAFSILDGLVRPVKMFVY